LIERTREAGNCWYKVTLREGKNQQIRRMFDSTGHSVVKLRRVRIGHITEQGLPMGKYRELKSGEINRFLQPNQKASKKKTKKASGKSHS